MPLLNKKRFVKNPIPLGLKDTDRVFYCEATNEIFDNYQEFAERIILCNSLVWACEETGRSGLTYIEAVECEKNAKKLLNEFPTELRRPILFLVTLSNRSALSDLTEDIFMYVRERFFIGEYIEFNSQGDHWIGSRVLEVIAPPSKDLSDQKNGVKQNERQFWPAGSTYEYEIEIKAQANGEIPDRLRVSASKLRRKKSTYTRDRNQLFIKHYVSKVDGIWKLKENACNLYEVNKVRFEEIFSGPLPKFTRSDTPKKNVKRPSLVSSSSSLKSPSKNGLVPTQKNKKQESMDKYLKPKSSSDKEPKSPKRILNSSGPVSYNKKLNRSSDSVKRPVPKKAAEKRKSTEEIIERELLEKRKKMMEHQQQLIEKKQQKQLDSQRKRDEKKKLEEFIKEWNKTREDLELEDLRDLPVPVPICLQIPNEYFGELIMLYEFFQTFAEQVGVKNFFPAGVTIDLLDRALSQTELAGPLFDFIHLLLVAIFRLQEDEEDEIGESYDSLAISEFDSHSTLSSELDPHLKLAAVAINCPLAFHGVPLQKLTIDATTISEVLRLHLLSSGVRVSETCHRWRIQEKGGYVGCVDDPGVVFRNEHANIMSALSEKCVAEFPVADKIAILECLVHQVMMFAAVRDLVHVNVDTFRQKRVELRTALAAEIRKEKELSQIKKKKAEKSASGNSGVENEAGAASRANNTAVAEEMTDEQLEKAEKDVQRRKDDLKRQLAEITIDNLRIQLAPIGMDRAYRRFWLFPSVPGVFVEDHELNPPPCLPRGTPKPNLALMKEKDPISYVRKLFQNEYNKENTGIAMTSAPSPKKGIARSANSSAVGVAPNTSGGPAGTSVGNAVSNDGKSEEPYRVALSCWGDNDGCPVHKRRSGRPRWSYYRTRGEFEKLLDVLNTRGKRESKLHAMLTQYQEFVLKGMAHPFINLNPTIEVENENGCAVPPEIRKSSRGNPSYDNAMFDFPPETEIEIVLESLLRNLILDIEEKSSAGGLGNLKVLDRSLWLEAITNNGYEQSCDNLSWGPMSNESKAELLEGDSKAVAKEKKYLNLDKFEALNQAAIDVNPKVNELARAILQLEQSIELHYLKPPLGMEKIKANKAGGPSEILKRWEVSLMSSTTLGQLFLHLCTLDNSIAWNRSALNANCRICRRRGDPESMLLCDMCNKGHHMYCLKPKLTKVPKGDWFCPYCKPPVKEPSQKKKHVYVMESDEEMDRKSPIQIEKMDLVNKGKCKTCGERGLTIGCSKCPKRFHLTCLLPPLRKAPTINWSCHSCRKISARKDENHDNFLNSLDSSGEPLRASRRKTSKAANEKIYRFVKQLRRPNSSDDEFYGDESEPPTLNGRGRSRRTRNSLESDYIGQLPLDNAVLQELLNKIMHHEDAWPFLRPVSRFEAADYAQIVKRPMDFATIKYNLNMLRYHTNSQVISDSMLVFNNCFLYNKETAEVYQAGVRLLEFFRRLCEEMNFKKELQAVENQSKRFNAEDDDDENDEEMDSGENAEMEVDEYEQAQPETEDNEEADEVEEEETEYDDEKQPATDEDEDEDEDDDYED